MIHRQQQRPDFPHYSAGMTIGLLGGTFDPPHAGHLEMSLCALRELGLDAVWWLVSPQNPLKMRRAHVLSRRLEWCRQITRQHKNIHITDLERSLNTTRTVLTLRRLKRFAPHTNFVWLMGADNLASCHHWEHWPLLFEKNKIAVFRRKCYYNNIMQTKAAIRYHHLQREGKRALLNHHSNGWLVLNNAYHPASSTQIRAENDLEFTNTPEGHY